MTTAGRSPSAARPPTARTRIKVCGVRRPGDAAHAAAAGADAVGFVRYAAAARAVSADGGRAVVAALPAFVAPVALLVDPSPEELAAVAAAHPSAYLQLHGHESPAVVRSAGRPVLKAVRVDRATFEQELEAWRRAIADAAGGLDHLKGFVLETAGPGVGGTGRANDWPYVADVARRGGFAGLPPVIAAGGLTPETVGEVVRAVRPWAVDVSSGVERVTGEKDPALVEAFVRAVREADVDRERGAVKPPWRSGE